WKLYYTAYQKAKQLYDQHVTASMSQGRTAQLCTCGSDMKRVRSQTAYQDKTADVNGAETEKRLRSQTELVINAGNLAPCPLHSGNKRGFTPPPVADLEKTEMVHQLLSSASFGFGLLNLALSVLPPHALKLIHFLGFVGDRSLGVSCLSFVAQSRHP